VSGGSGGKMSIWDTTNMLEGNFIGHTLDIFSLKVLSNGNLASGSDDKTIKIWDPRRPRFLKSLDAHEGTICTLEQLNNGWLVSGSWENTVKIWDLNSDDALATLQMSGSVLKLGVLSDGESLAIQCDNLDQLISVNTRTWERERIGCGKISTMTMLKDGYLATSFQKINIWDTTTTNWNLLRTLDGHKSGITCLHLLDDGKLASGSVKGKIKIWDTTNGQLIHTFRAHDTRITSITTLSNGCLVSCSSSSAEIKIWE
jgi:WD40 repeat protein